MSELKFIEEQNLVSVELDGSATIVNAGEILNLFVNANNQNKDIEINHQKVEDFDITYLQLLSTLHRATTESSRSLRLGGTNPESFIALVKGSGLPLSFLESQGQSKVNAGGHNNE